MKLLLLLMIVSAAALAEEFSSQADFTDFCQDRCQVRGTNGHSSFERKSDVTVYAQCYCEDESGNLKGDPECFGTFDDPVSDDAQPEVEVKHPVIGIPVKDDRDDAGEGADR